MQVRSTFCCPGHQLDITRHESPRLEFLNRSTLVEEWEHSVAACLAVLCHTAADENPVGAVAAMVRNYLALSKIPELAVFRTRVGLAVLDLSPHPRQVEASRRLAQEAATSGDGYIARDVIAHPLCQREMSHSEYHTLSAAVAAAGLGQGQIPAPLEEALRDAMSLASDVWERHLTCRGSSNSSRSLRGGDISNSEV
ncbi:hypothetical protein ABCR94_28125 [Streptomyces sp. 21So2-11]|uniref:hypothetical protein n=1 Tax=Streptomyces sp. 21So2-11 TaxID=3144408 RepID=UPI003219F68E